VTYLGKMLVESTRNLEFDACRALLGFLDPEFDIH
jgi:hypothetical protein